MFLAKNIRKEFVFMQNNFTTFRPEIKDVKIKKVGMDMFMQFRNAVYSYLPDADIVADKYHIIRQANRILRDVR